MTYSKPELLSVDTAMAAIQGSDKQIFPSDGVDLELTAAGAYEVDE